MKKLLLMSALGLALFQNASAQDANVYLSNIDANNGYTGYSNSTIQGIYFEVVSEGDNSNNIISDFQVSLYLLECDNSGTPTSSTPITIKTYDINGMQQLHSIDYSNESVDLSQVNGLADGTYRLGVWVNSDIGVPQPPDKGSDNAALVTLNSNGNDVQSIINYSSSATAVVSSLKDLGIAMPNPMSQDQFSSFINTNQFDAAKAYDFLGQEQNINSLNKGVYVLRLTKNNKMYTGKISIQ